MEFQKRPIRVWPSSSLVGKEDLPYELIEWLRGRRLSVRQSKDLLIVTKTLIEEEWCTEEERIMI